MCAAGSFGFAIVLFALCEAAFDEAVIEEFFDAPYVCDVCAYAENHALCPVLSLVTLCIFLRWAFFAP